MRSGSLATSFGHGGWKTVPNIPWLVPHHCCHFFWVLEERSLLWMPANWISCIPHTCKVFFSLYMLEDTQLQPKLLSSPLAEGHISHCPCLGLFRCYFHSFYKMGKIRKGPCAWMLHFHPPPMHHTICWKSHPNWDVPQSFYHWICLPHTAWGVGWEQVNSSVSPSNVISYPFICHWKPSNLLVFCHSNNQVLLLTTFCLAAVK